MYENSPFLLRRVFAGVLVVAAFIALAGFGWAKYQINRYHDQESRVVSSYATAYQTCMSTQGSYGDCATRVDKMCESDGFWAQQQPFSFGLGGNIDESATKCSFGATAS